MTRQVETKTKCPKCDSTHLFKDKELHWCLTCRFEWKDNEICPICGVHKAFYLEMMHEECFHGH